MGGLFGGNSAAATTSAPTVSSLRVQTTVLGRCIPWVFGTTRVAPNLVQYDDFKAIAHTEKQAAGGKGGGGGSTSTTSYTYTAALILAMCRGEIDGVGRIWVGKEQKTAQQLNLDIYNGSNTQTPHPHWLTKHAASALAYRGTAYAASPAYDLGDSGEVPSHNFEVFSKTRFSASISDASPAVVATELVTNKIDGLGIDAATLDFSKFSDFCVANSIFISPCYDEQMAAHEALTRIAEIGHSAIVDSEGKLKLIPYADQSATGNGVTFTPNSTPIYDLNEDDFLDQDQPIKITRSSQADADNHFQVLFYDRTSDYNEATAEAQDQGHVEKFGLRTRDPEQYHEICDAQVAQKLVNFQKDRSLSIRNTFDFKLSMRYCLLEPMDIVTITSSNDGLDKYPVRIIEIEESEDGDLSIKAEDCPLGTQSPAQIPHQPSAGTSVDFNVAAGNVNDPVIFEPSLQLTRGAPQIWAAVSGGQNWGGAQVWVSLDGNTYSKIGVITAPARQGILTAPLSTAGAMIDSVNNLSVSTDMSGGVLLPATQVEAEAGVTLFYADGELMSYRDATLTGVNTYDLGYLIRGQYGTAVAAHAAGKKFARLDDAVFKYPYQPDWVGKTIHLKFVSYNKFGTGQQSIADVTDYQYTVIGAPLAPVQNLALEGTWTGKEAKIRWDLVDGATSYEVQVYAGSPAVIERVVTTVTEGRFTYSLDMLQKDGVASRNLIFKVRAISVTGNKSLWAQVVANNPQIGALQGLSIQSGIRQAFLSFTKPGDLDWAGVCVWIGTTANFTASDSNKVFEGMTSLVNLTSLTNNSPLLPNVTYYLRAAGYDEFGKDGLAVSASMAFVVNGVVAELNSVAANMLESTLGSTIGLITAPASTSGSVNARVGSLSTAASTAVSAAQAAVASLSTAAAAAVSSEATIRANAVLAEANRAATAEAQLSTSTSTLAAATSTALANNAAAIQAEASTRSSETGALTTQYNTLVAQTQAMKTSQTFGIVGDGLDVARWGGSSLLSVLPDTSAFGGNVLRAGQNSGNDQVNILLNDKIKVTDDVLKVTARWRRVSGVGGVYVSLRVLDEYSGYIIDRHGLSNAKPTLGEWQTTVIYYKRGALIGASGLSATTPKRLDSNGLYVKPYLVFNYSQQAGECELDYYSIEMISASAIALIDDERTARTDGDTANATNIATLSAAVNSNKTSADAGIATAQTATASLSTATATSVASLTATVSTNKTAADGSITALSTLVVNGDAANASTINALSTSTNTKTASLSTSVIGLSTAVTSADAALGVRIDGVTAAVNTTAASLSTSVYTAQTATASLSTATANSLTALNATVSTNKSNSDASVLTAQTATASLSTATAGSITTLSTTVSTKTTSLSTSVVTAQAATSSLSTATATSVANLTATISTNKSTATAGVSTSQAAVASLSTATANTLTTLTATVSTNKTSTDASIVTAQAAVASLSTATVTSITSLQARLLTRPNLLPNGGFENGLAGWENTSGWTVSDHPTFGRVATAVKNGTATFQTAAIPCEPNVSYTWTGDAALTATSGQCGFDVVFFDSSGASLVATAQAAPSASFGFSSSGRDTFQVSAVSPATAATMKVRFEYINVSGCTYMGVRQVKIEQGSLPATPYTNEGSSAQTFAGILSVQTATASLSTATASSVATLQTSLNGNTASIQNQQTSINGLSAQWAVKTDVNGHIAGFGLANTVNNGTPSSAFIVSAGAFGVAAPGKPAVYAFVIDTVKGTVGVNGSLMVDGTVAGTAIVANSVTAAQLAVKAVTADKIDVVNLSAISATLGNVSGGAFFGGNYSAAYAWPTAQGSGFHLSAGGLIMGNYVGGKYFQVTSDGNMYAPGMRVENGVLTINQVNVIDTSNIVNNAVTKVTSISSDGDAAVSVASTNVETTLLTLTVSAVSAATIVIWSTFELMHNGVNEGATSGNTAFYRLLVDGGVVASRDTRVGLGVFSGVAMMESVNVGAGLHTIQLLARGAYLTPSSNVMTSRYRRMVCMLSYK